MVKLTSDYSKEYALEIKKYLTTYPQEVEEIYGIKVPHNINSMKKKEFVNYVLSIQKSVYKAVAEMGYATPFYSLINHFLFVNFKPITIDIVTNPNALND